MAKTATAEIMTEDYLSKELELIKSMNLYEKISAVSSEVGRVQMTLNVATKTDKNGNPIKSYKAISINDVVDALIPLLAKYRLAIIPTEKEIIEQEQIERTTQYGTSNQFYIRLKATYRVVNIDKPEEYVESYAFGDGIDSGDKCTGKALTYARKYVLIDLFNLSKGEDPDEEASPQCGYKKKISPADLAVRLTTATTNLKKIGVDTHDDAVVAYTLDAAKVTSTDPGVLLGDADAMMRVIGVYEDIYRKKQK